MSGWCPVVEDWGITCGRPTPCWEHGSHQHRWGVWWRVAPGQVVRQCLVEGNCSATEEEP